MPDARKPLGAGLLAMASDNANINVDRHIAIAGKPASTGSLAVDFILQLEICCLQTERSDL
ncbi:MULTISPECIES: hypothetical protein [unclassified Pseudomonas]|uniref:Uncharacterized protein n=1 Tax=Pseudomonas sp. MYb327 TaxID=2745230 RepID=A0AAU8ECV2_9PSED